MSSPDTIVAIASPAGRGAVGIVRISGSQVPRIAAEVLGSVPAPRLARLSRFLDSSGASLDQAGQYRLENLNAQLPSTNIEFANPRQNSIAVRGLGNNPANDALESSVGVYLDNVYLGRASMANMDLIDVDPVLNLYDREWPIRTHQRQ